MTIRRKMNDGFSLIELSIILTVFGLALEIMLQTESMLRKEKYITNTGYRGEAIQTALDKFLSKNKRLPCPAARALGPDDANAGIEQCLTALPINTCADGLCRVTGRRDTGADADALPDNVYIGAIPYITLNLPSQIELDGWGNKFLYAVSQHMTDAATYQWSYGVIDAKIYDEASHSNISPTTPINGVHTPYATPFIVLSHGSDGVGAYSVTGRQSRPCAGAGQDLGNCNDTTPGDEAVFYNYITKFKSYADGADHYDDWVIATKSDMRIDRWGYSDAARGDIINTAIARVGINTDQPTETLGVDGNIRAGRAIGNSYCNAATTGCIPATMVAGAGINCNNGAVTGIRNANVACSSTVSTAGITPSTCPAGQLVIGFTAAGVIQCQ